MKKLIEMLLPAVGKIGYLKYLILGLLSGLLNFLFINLITRIIGLFISGELAAVSRDYMLIFACIIFLLIYVRRALSTSIIKLSQQIFWRLRKQVLSLMLNASYEQLKKRKKTIHSVILGDVAVLTDASMSIIGFSVAVVLSFSCLIYLFLLSYVLFFVTITFASLGVIFYYFNSKKNREDFESARSLENAFSRILDTIINGFKEIYIEPKKGSDIFNTKVVPISQQAFTNNIKAYTGYLNNQITGQILFYVLISIVLLVFSTRLEIAPEKLVSFVFTLLYLLGSLETIMVLLPNLTRAKVAANHLMDLIEDLKLTGNCEINPESEYKLRTFTTLNISDLTYKYNNSNKPFEIGPISFEVSKGELIFIYGGNGSGKTTFIYTLLGLLKPNNASIQLNGTNVDISEYRSYRNLFSVVFCDFYLFNELLGVEDVDMEKWNHYLRLFEIDDKVRLQGKSFSTIDLSAGQRKRLALISCLLEGKPILVLDEWAADQDPRFRRKFYEDILPIIQKEGKTVIAITHDDKYYHHADKLFKMESGVLTHIDNESLHEMP